MRITMLSDTRGSENGVTVMLYTAGATVDVGPALAKSFLDAGFAVVADSRAESIEDEAPKATPSIPPTAKKPTAKPTASPVSTAPPPNVWE